jgi:hypothetical protein
LLQNRHYTADTVRACEQDSTMRLPRLVLLLFVTAAQSLGQSIPAFKAKALDNSEINLPSPGSQQFLILIVGFSRKSGKACEVWSKKISADYQDNARISYFSLPVLETAPTLLRPMIVYGMRKGVPVQELHRLVPLYSDESEWKKLVNFSNPDDAYLIVATPNGHVIWQAHGPYSDAIYSDLQNFIATVQESNGNFSESRYP